MTATDWTAVGRRLSVRRATNRPPWRGREASHGSILAPLALTVAATMAASVAVGVGVALAKAERDRRGARTRSARGRRFELWPEERPPQGLRRMALEQLDLAIELLEGDSDGALAENAVHETRKALKRLRALIRLLAGELGEEDAARENAVLRDAGRRLAATRDAEVLVATLDALLERNPGELGHRPGVAALRSRLVAEREAVVDVAVDDAATRAQVAVELRAARERISQWRLPDREGIETVEPGLSRIYRQGRRRHRRAARGEGDRARLMHIWRKRVKDLRYSAEMLDRFDPGRGRGSGRGKRASRWPKRRQRRPETEAIRQTARRADELGELLGDEHDLVLLAGWILAESDSRDATREDADRGTGLEDGDVAAAPIGAAQDASARTGASELASERVEAAADASVLPAGEELAAGARTTQLGGPDGGPELRGPETEPAGAGGAGSRVDDETRSILLKLIARRRRRLRREALRRGGRLYRRRPKAFVARTRRAYERAAHR
jgi:hypothetical protein